MKKYIFLLYLIFIINGCNSIDEKLNGRWTWLSGDKKIESMTFNFMSDKTGVIETIVSPNYITSESRIEKDNFTWTVLKDGRVKINILETSDYTAETIVVKLNGDQLITDTGVLAAKKIK